MANINSASGAAVMTRSNGQIKGLGATDGAGGGGCGGGGRMKRKRTGPHPEARKSHAIIKPAQKTQIGSIIA